MRSLKAFVTTAVCKSFGHIDTHLLVCSCMLFSCTGLLVASSFCIILCGFVWFCALLWFALRMHGIPCTYVPRCCMRFLVFSSIGPALD